jgi:hypothetical protein
MSLSVRGSRAGESSRFGDPEDDKALATTESTMSLYRIVSVVTQATERRPVLVVRTMEQHEIFRCRSWRWKMRVSVLSPEIQGTIIVALQGWNESVGVLNPLLLVIYFMSIERTPVYVVTNPLFEVLSTLFELILQRVRFGRSF